MPISDCRHVPRFGASTVQHPDPLQVRCMYCGVPMGIPCDMSGEPPERPYKPWSEDIYEAMGIDRPGDA